jgi:hypothetical protein
MLAGYVKLSIFGSSALKQSINPKDLVIECHVFLPVLCYVLAGASTDGCSVELKSPPQIIFTAKMVISAN